MLKNITKNLLPKLTNEQTNERGTYNHSSTFSQFSQTIKKQDSKCDKCNTIKKESKKKKRLQFLEALKASNGIVSSACDAVGINRSTFYRWCNDDEEFRKFATDVEEVAIDFVESKLFNCIEAGNITAIIFYLKNKGKMRGYSEKYQVEIEKYAPELDFNKLSEDFDKLSEAELMDIANGKFTYSQVMSRRKN